MFERKCSASLAPKSEKLNKYILCRNIKNFLECFFFVFFCMFLLSKANASVIIVLLDPLLYHAQQGGQL